jgi:hypothetical protein
MGARTGSPIAAAILDAATSACSTSMV